MQYQNFVANIKKKTAKKITRKKVNLEKIVFCKIEEFTVTTKFKNVRI